uniref:TrmH family RNA methyltransferase n=1 Tax=uncultured Draconibacterium sp. TaxID=1573823 RepID=UPI0032167E40
MNTNSVQFFKSKSSEKVPVDSEIIIAAWTLANPENIGKIIRLAHNVGAGEALFIRNKEVHREAKIKKTAGFSFDQMNWNFISESEFLEKIKSDYELAVLETCDGSTNIFTTQLPKKILLLAGSESHGIPENIIKLSKHKVYVPMPGGCKSLNISNALSVAAFEWYRQQTSFSLK